MYCPTEMARLLSCLLLCYSVKLDLSIQTRWITKVFASRVDPLLDNGIDYNIFLLVDRLFWWGLGFLPQRLI